MPDQLADNQRKGLLYKAIPDYLAPPSGAVLGAVWMHVAIHLDVALSGIRPWAYLTGILVGTLAGVWLWQFPRHAVKNNNTSEDTTLS